MIPKALLEAAAENMAGTYFTLGAATPSSRVWQDEGFKACLGEAPHPICNFAMNLDLTPWVARHLADIAERHPNFSVYLTPCDKPDHGNEILERAGFSSHFSLLQMIHTGEAPKSPEFEPVEAIGNAARVETADFMVGQFFSGQSGTFKRLISQATSSSPDLTLYSLFDRDRRIAAIMTYRAAGTLGIYNLCVEGSRRNRGIGSALVRFALEKAYRLGDRAILQCESRLVPWYRSLGFERAGDVMVFRLSNRAGIAIME